MSNLPFEISLFWVTGKTTRILSALQALFPSSDWFDLKYRQMIPKSYTIHLPRKFLWNHYLLSIFCFVKCHLTGQCLPSQNLASFVRLLVLWSGDYGWKFPDLGLLVLNWYKLGCGWVGWRSRKLQMHRTDVEGKIATWGSSKEPSLGIQTLHQVAMNTPSHALTGCCAEIIAIFVTFVPSSHKSFSSSTRPMLQSGRFKSHVVVLKKWNCRHANSD